MLQDFLSENKMICLNMKYQKKPGKKWTFTYPNGIKAQLDLILINRKWINSAMNCEPFNSFNTVSSDHRIVTATIRLSLRANKPKSTKNPRYNWSALQNKNISNQFKLSLKKRFSLLGSPPGGEHRELSKSSILQF